MKQAKVNWLKRVRTRLFLTILMICLASMTTISLVFYFQFRAALTERILLQLSSIRHLKQYQVEQYLRKQWEAFERMNDQKTCGIQDRLLINPDNKHLLSFLDKIPDDFTIEGIHDLTPYTHNQQLLLAFVRRVGTDLYVLITNVEEVQSILLERTGMGETGETYLVGRDHHLRSISRFFPEDPYFSIISNTYGTHQALSGNSENSIYQDYRGIRVFGSFDLIDFLGVNWAIMSEIDEEEAFAPLNQLKNTLVITFLILTLLLLSISYGLSQIMVRPLQQIKKALSEMSMGKPIGEVNEKYSSYEFSEMFAALNRLIFSLNEAVAFAQSIGSGDFTRDYHRLSDEDALGLALLQMRNDLVNFQQKEETYKLAVQRSLIEGQENERKRLARDLHDGLGPLLTSLRLNVSMVTLEPAQKESLKGQIDETIAEVRRLSSDLMPQSLIDFGVGIALNSWLETLRKSTSIEIIYKNDLMEKSSLAPQIHIGLYRIAQESILNALKHAETTQLKVSITEFDDKVSYYISDNGKGFDTERNTGGLGLMNMRERVRLLNGSFYIESTFEGTRIEVEIPLI